eukprot:TRINITY_DN3140_c0_g2_i1.p1 TRINITY_DN3140_c0_g2~~TRINITY_DN3140_c0_g2_i1.p1  ORF type:complete len:200 (-),score=70.42 TRINITY_DN3140_c0_g2_i1:84-683(-)
MTTAHKPTWNPARGNDDRGGRNIAPSQQFSSRDLPGHTKLKYRKTGQNTNEEVSKRNLREELEEKEKKHFKEKASKLKERADSFPAIEAPKETKEITTSRKRKVDEVYKEARAGEKDVDADDSDSGSSSELSDSDADDNDEDTALLMQELEKIKREKEAEARRLEQEQKDRESENRSKAIMAGNPLLNQESSDYTIKKK